MANKGGIIAVGAIVGLGALLAFAGRAKAGTKPNGEPEEDLQSPEACAAYKAERSGLINNRDAIQGYITELDAAAIEAYQNGRPEEGAFYEAQAAGQRQALSQVKAQINELNKAIEKCP